MLILADAILFAPRPTPATAKASVLNSGRLFRLVEQRVGWFPVSADHQRWFNTPPKWMQPRSWGRSLSFSSTLVVVACGLEPQDEHEGKAVNRDPCAELGLGRPEGL